MWSVSIVFRQLWKSQAVNRSRLYSTSTRCGTKFKYKERVDIPAQTTALLAGRKWLPGALSAGSKYPTYVASPRDNFPALYTVNSPSTGSTPIGDFAKDAREIIEGDLHIYGAILFRGLPLQGGDDFSMFVRSMDYSLIGYEGGTAVRHKVAADVLTASNDPPEYSIEPHNEMAYSDHYPMKVFFFCDVAALPGHGGESVITDVREVVKKLDPEVVDKARKLGIRYCRHLPTRTPGGYTSWQEGFFTEDRADVEKYMVEHKRAYRWESDGALTYWYNLPAFVTHPKTGEDVWFNQYHSHHATYFKDHPLWAHLDIPDDRYPFHCYYGDGSEVEEEVLQHIRDVLWEVSVGFQMKRGDLLALDNIYVQHSRLGFKGKRKLLVSLSMD
ncbi:dapdiamide synthesis protein DdaC-like [Ptychodera flava]|uniref:dapdiamide synthesis protein DdaC-like n=1 Tax=Ptychodera flava TaxID=63121 RepID=UPI00396A7206